MSKNGVIFKGAARDQCAILKHSEVQQYAVPGFGCRMISQS